MAKAPKLPTTREIFGRNLRIARLMRGWSQEELAFKSAVDPSYLSQVERGLRNVSIDHMSQLADALEVAVHDLVNPHKFTLNQS